MFTRSHFSLKLPTYVETILTKQLHDLIVTKLCQTPGDRLYVLKKTRTKKGKQAFQNTGVKVWNELPDHIKRAPSIEVFKGK